MAVHTGMITTNSTTMELKKAILVYEGGTGFATVHDVHGNQETGMTIGQGVPANMEALAEIASTLAKNLHLNDYLPVTVLSVGLGALVWWVPPCKARNIWFKTQGDQLGKVSGKTPHPGLIFRVIGTKWQVFAVKGNKRPIPSDRLYQAPYFNVWEGGGICVGNVQIPDGSTTNTISAWEAAFFNSFFTHPNTKRLVKYKGGGFAFWKDMLAGKFKSFPERVLIDIDATLADLLSGRKRNN